MRVTGGGMTQDELDALPVTVNIVTAGRVLGIGRSLAYSLARKGEFPVRLLRVGSSYRVSRADILTYLGDQTQTEPAGVAPETNCG